MKRIEDNLRDFWYNIKCTSIQIIGVLEEEEKDKGFKKISEEIIAEKFPSMGKEIVNQVHEARSPIQDETCTCLRKMPRHILSKLTKIRHNEKILKSGREKQQVPYKKIPYD